MKKVLVILVLAVACVAQTSRTSATKEGNNTFTGTNTFITPVNASDGSASLPAITFTNSTSTGIYRSGSLGMSFAQGGAHIFRLGSNAIIVSGNNSLNFEGSTPGSGSDLILTRDAANTFAQRNGANAQQYNMYASFTDASNYSRVELSSVSSYFKINAHTIIAGVNSNSQGIEFGTNNTPRWHIENTGHLVAVTDNNNDIGASGATRPRTIYLATSVNSPTYVTTTNCSSAGGTCSSAAAGSVTIAAAGTTVTVTTTAVTANSQIFVQEDSSLGTKLGVTCNTTTGRDYTITARTAGTSFVITSSAAPVTNPACLSYFIVN